MTAGQRAARAASDAPDVTLVATVHGDPETPRRLRGLLAALAPACILVEISPFGYAFRVRNRAALSRAFREGARRAGEALGVSPRAVALHPAVDAVRRQMLLPGEVTAASGYGRRRGVPVFLADDSRWSRGWIGRWPALFSPENLRLLYECAPAPPSFAREYEKAAKRMSGGPLPDAGDPGEAARERFLAREVLAAARLFPGRVVYVGGWRHCEPRSGSLRGLLGLGAGRVRLLRPPAAT